MPTIGVSPLSFAPSAARRRRNLVWGAALLTLCVPMLAAADDSPRTAPEAIEATGEGDAGAPADVAEGSSAADEGDDAPADEKTRAAIVHLTGMTYTTSRGDSNELVLHAEKARYNATAGLAHLKRVRAEVSEADDREGFEMTCDRARLNLGNNNFHAEGNVVGSTAGGRRFAAPWARFDHSQGMLYTDAPVTITESTGTYRGGGFQYFVHEGRFKLLGGATVVQEER